MSYQLQPGLLPVNGQLIETYFRESRASNSVKEALGLPIDQPISANIGISSIEEYIVFVGDNIAKDNSKYWALSPVGQPLKIESIYIDSPLSDRFTFKIRTRQNIEIFSLILSRSQTPYDLPDAPLDPNYIIEIVASDQIDLVRIVAKPVVILQSFNGYDSFDTAVTNNPEIAPLSEV